MQILNLINKEKSDIDYSISRFPDGEVQITLGEFSHKEEIDIKCRITSTEELFILMQACDILRRHEMDFYISIYYLMGMRMDRVMDFNRPFTLSVICKILDRLGAITVYLFSPHSDKYLTLFEHTRPDSMWVTNPFDEVREKLNYKFQLVYPDEGAANRYHGDNAILGEKYRDLASGKIISIKVKNPEDLEDKALLIRDDLCDGGGTFVGLAKALREINPNNKLYIYVDHMVNPKGIENLSKNFDHVWFTNSYKTWENLPENVTQIEIV